MEVNVAGPSCGSCGNGEVRKLSAITSAGSWTGVSDTEGVGVAFGLDGGAAIGVGSASTTHAGATALARLLAPPRRPQAGSPIAVAAAVVVGMLTGVFYVAGGMMWKACGSGLLTMLVVLVPLAFWRSVVSWKRQTHADAVWREQTARWQQLWYCAKCHSVSNPDTGKAAAAQEYRGALL